jgi:hypothetical protein
VYSPSVVKKNRLRIRCASVTRIYLLDYVPLIYDVVMSNTDPDAEHRSY